MSICRRCMVEFGQRPDDPILAKKIFIFLGFGGRGFPTVCHHASGARAVQGGGGRGVRGRVEEGDCFCMRLGVFFRFAGDRREVTVDGASLEIYFFYGFGSLFRAGGPLAASLERAYCCLAHGEARRKGTSQT